MSTTDVVRIGQQGSLANAQTNDEDHGLKAELQYLRRLRASPRAGPNELGSYQGRKCAGCGGPFGRFYNTGASCFRCRLRVCRQCRTEITGPTNNKDPHWICNLCYKIAELHAATGEWIYESLEQEGSGKVTFSPVDILKRSIRRAWTINGPPRQWSATRKSPELRIYRSLPSRHQNYREAIAENRVVDQESKEEETVCRNDEDSNTKNLASNDRTKREEKSKEEDDVPLKDDAIKLRKSSARTKSEEDVQEQSSPRVSLIKPPRILSKLISPDIKSVQPKHGDRKSNIPVFRRSSKEFEDIKSPQEVSKRSLIPQRYRGSTDDLRRSREDISLPSLIPKLLSPRNKEERLKRQDSKDDVRPAVKTNRKDDLKASCGKDDSPSGKSGLRIFRRDFSREDTSGGQCSANSRSKLCAEERVGEAKSRTWETNRSKIKEPKESSESRGTDVLENVWSRKFDDTSMDFVSLTEERKPEDSKSELSRSFDRSGSGFRKFLGEEFSNPEENLESLIADRSLLSEEFLRVETTEGKESESLKEAIDNGASEKKEDMKDSTMEETISPNDVAEEFEDVKRVQNSMRDSTDSLSNNNDGDAITATVSGERKAQQDSGHGKKMEEFQVIRRKFSKEEFSNPDDTDDTPNKRCSSHLSPEASPLSTRSSRYSPRESESEPTPALPRKTAGDSSSASQRIRDAISRTRRESNSSTRYESSGSESVRFSETGLHGYVELARKVKFFGGNGNGAVPSNIAGDEIVQRDSATSAGEDEPHDDCHGRSAQVSSQGRTMLRRRRQFDAQGSRRRGRSHARICCAEELQSLQTLQVVGRGDGRQASPTNNPNGEPIVDYRRLVFISSDSSSGREEDDADSSCSSSSYLNGLPRGGSHAHSLEDCDWDYFESGSLPLPAGVSCAVGTDNPATVQESNISQDWSCCPGRGSSACQACGGSRGANVLPVPVPIPVPVPYPVPIPASLWTGDFAAAASSMISRSAEAHSEPGTLRLRGDPTTTPWFAWHPRFGQHLHSAARFDPRLAAFDPATCTFRPEEVVNARFYGSVIEAATIAATDSAQDHLQQQEKPRASRDEKDEETKQADTRLQEDTKQLKSPLRSAEQSRGLRTEESAVQESRKDQEEEEEKDDEEETQENERKDSLSSSFEGRAQRMFQRSREDSGSSSGRSSADSSDLEEDSSSHRFSRVFVVNDDSLTSDNDIEDNGDEEDDSDSAAEGGVTLKRVTALPEEEPVVLQHIRFLNEDACFENSLGKPAESKEKENSKVDEQESSNGRCSDQPERRRRARKNLHDEERRFLSMGSHKLPEEMYLADDNDGSENPIELRSIKSLDPDSIEVVTKVESKDNEQKNQEWNARKKTVSETTGKNSLTLNSPKDDSGTELKSPSSSDAWDSTIIPDSLEIPEEDSKKILEDAVESPVRASTPTTAHDHECPPFTEYQETQADKEMGSAGTSEIFNRPADNDTRDKDESNSGALDSTNLSSGSNTTATTTGSEVSSDELHEYEVNPSSGQSLLEEILAARIEPLPPRRPKSYSFSGSVGSKVDNLRAIIEGRDLPKLEKDSRENEKGSAGVAEHSVEAMLNESREVVREESMTSNEVLLRAGEPDKEKIDAEERDSTSGKVGETLGSAQSESDGAHDSGACPVRAENPSVPRKLVGASSESGQVRGGEDDASGKVSKPVEDAFECNDSDIPESQKNFQGLEDAESVARSKEITEDVEEDVRSNSEVNGDRCTAESGRYVSAGKTEVEGQGQLGSCSSSGEVRGDAAERGSTRFHGSVERRPSTRKENGFPPAVPTRNPPRDAQHHFPSTNNNNNNSAKYRSLVMITQEAAYQPVSVITSDTTTLLQPEEVHASSQGLAGYFQLALEAVNEQPSRKNGQPPRRPLMVKRSPGVANCQAEVEVDSGLSVGSASESDDVSVKNNTKTANGQVLDVVRFDSHEEKNEVGKSDGRTRISSQSSDDNSGSAGGVVILEEGLADDDSWVEEVSHDEDEPGATTATEESSEDEANNLGDREEELRGYHRQAIDFTLHTIVEESCEESEAEPSLAAGSPSKKQRPPSASELEKYFFFGLGDGNNSSLGSREVDSLSETSSIYSEGLESLGQEEGNGTPQGQDRSREEGFLNSSRLEKYFLSEFLGFDQDRRDSDGSVGSDSEGRPSPEAQRRKRLVRARGTGRSHSSSLDNLLALTQSSQNLSSQNSLQDLSLNPDSQETQSEGSSTETDGAEDGQTPVFGTDGQFDTVKRKKKKPRNLGTQSPRVPDDRNKTPEPSREMTLVGEVVVEADGEAMNSEDSERAKTPQPESVLSPSSTTNNGIGSSNSSSVQNESSRNVQGSSGDSGSYNQRSKQQSRDSGFVGSCDDLLQHQKSPDDAQQNGEINQETARNESSEKCRATRQGSNEINGNNERGYLTKLDHPLSHTSLPHLPTASLSRKDSFNNWSSDEETNLMMSKMRQFFKTMVANSNGQAQPTNNTNSSAASPAPSPRLPGYSSKARLCAQNRTKPPQLVYFENELTRLMKTVPGIRDEQVREIVEYLSSEDTWSDSYDSSDYTSSDLEGAAAGGRRSALQEQISQSCQQIISKFDTASNDGLLVDKEREEKNSPTAAGIQPPGLGRDTAFVYQKLVQSFTKMTGDGVSSDASSTPHSSPPLIAKVMHHIGSRLVALMHEVSEGGPAVQHHSTWRRYSQHHRTPSSASTTEDDDSTSDSTNPPPSAHLQLPRSKSHDPLLLINNHPTASTGQEGEEREASDYERFSWRGSFESALMAGDSRTKLSLLACSGDVSVGASASASALAMAAKRRSAGDLLFNPKSFSREQLDRVRSCGSIGGGSGGVGASVAGGSIEERIWTNRRRSSVPDANTRGESGASAGDEDTEDELEYGGESRATTLPRGMQSGIAAATNSLPRLPASTVPSGLAQSPATSTSAMHKAHSVYHFLPQHSGVKSARYRPPGFARNSNTAGAIGGPKRALSAPGLQVSAGQGSAKRENSRSRRQQAMSLTPDDGSSLSEACSTPIIGGGSRGSSSHTVMDMDDMEPGLHSGHLATRASLSSLGARSDSMASVYSGAGEGRCCRSVVVTGEVEFALQYDYKHLTFEVHVTKCKNLAPVDVKRKRSDPYVKVYLLPDKSKSGKRKTKVKKHTLNPEFNETLKFHMSLSGLETRTLWLTVWHSDMFGRNDFLGEVRMPLENKIFDDPTPRWYPLQERTEPFDDPVAYKGEVIVGLKFVPPDPTQQERERDVGSDSRAKARKNWSRGALHVLVKEARNLQTRGKNSGTCDPFCKSYLLPDKGRSGKQKTGVVRRSAGSPVWGHTFIYKDVSLQELAERGLELTVWDHDRIASNEFLGGVRFNLGTGKHYGKAVDWMDATGRELSLWQSMLERPNFWVEGAVTLRPNLHSHGKNNG